MINTQGFNPATGEWNDSLTGDFIWTNTNIGEAFSDVMTPFTWSLVGALYDELSVLPGYAPAGNIGGRAYQNGSVIYATLRAMGRQPADMTELGGRVELPHEMTIPVITLPRLAFAPVMVNTLRLMARMGRWLRGLNAFIAQNPQWCEQALARIATMETREAVLAFAPIEIQRRREAYWRLVSIAWRYTDAVGPLRRDLIALVGEDDASTLLSGVSERVGGAGLPGTGGRAIAGRGRGDGPAGLLAAIRAPWTARGGGRGPAAGRKPGLAGRAIGRVGRLAGGRGPAAGRTGGQSPGRLGASRGSSPQPGAWAWPAAGAGCRTRPATRSRAVRAHPPGAGGARRGHWSRGACAAWATGSSS